MADDLKDELEEFEQHDDHWSNTRAEMLECLNFCRLGIQWDEKIVSDREKQGRPVLTINKMPAFARQIINEARRNKPSIKVHPSDDKADIKTAEIINGLIRNIEHSSNADVAYDTALEYAVYCGAGYFDVDIDFSSYDQFEQEITINRITNPLNVLGDINSVAADASDWNTAWVTEMMPRDAFELEYPDADPVSWKGGDYDSRWADKDDVRVACHWSRKQIDSELVKLNDGQVMLGDVYLKHAEVFQQAGIQVVEQRPTKIFQVRKQILTAAEELESQDWPGRYIPIVPVYGEEFTVEGKRYFHSMFKHAMDPARMFNYWRTAATELVALAPKVPFIGKTGAFDTDAKNWATANTENHPYLQFDGDVAPQREAPPQIPAGALQEASSADMDMKSIIGIFDPGMGNQRDSEISGKAISEWRVGSDIANFHFLDNLSRALEYAGKVIIDLVPHVYNEERVVRVMGLDGEPKNVPVMQEYQEQGVSRINDFSAGRYDLTVETGPNFSTRRQEAVSSMQSMVTAAPQLMGIIGDLIAKNMDWEGADEIAKRLKIMLPPQVAAMEGMEGIPEEARAHVAQAQGQIKQIEEALQQKDMMLAEYDQANKQLKLDIDNKQGELRLKEREQELKLELQQRDAQHDKELEEVKGDIKKELALLQDSLEPIVHAYRQQNNLI